MKLKTLPIILTIYSLLAAADIILTFMNRDLLKAFEINPLVARNFMVLVFINLLVVWFLVYSYRKTPFIRYVTISWVVWLMPLRALAIRNGIELLTSPPTQEIIQAAEALPQSVKTSEFAIIAVATYALPLLMSFLIYWLFSLDHKIEKKT